MALSGHSRPLSHSRVFSIAEGIFTMRLNTRPAIALALLAASFGAIAPQALSAQTGASRRLDGDWIYVEDRTEGRALEQLGPPMSSTFAMRAEGDAIVLVSGHGSGHRNVGGALDSSWKTTKLFYPRMFITISRSQSRRWFPWNSRGIRSN